MKENKFNFLLDLLSLYHIICQNAIFFIEIINIFNVGTYAENIDAGGTVDNVDFVDLSNDNTNILDNILFAIDTDTSNQEISSGKTSINANKLPVVFTRVDFRPNLINLTLVAVSLIMQ